MTELQVYLWLMLDSIKNIYVFPIIGFFISLVVMIPCMEEGKESIKWLWVHITRPMMILFTVLFTLTFFLPSSKQFAVIKILPIIANNNTVNKIPKEMEELYIIAKEHLKSLNVEKDNKKTKKNPKLELSELKDTIAELNNTIKILKN